MPISDIVDVTITKATARVSQRGFGVPLILGYSQRFADRVRYYRSTTAMIADGFLVTDPEVLAAAALEAQEPRVERWAVARADVKATYSVRVTVAVVANTRRYVLKVNGTEVVFTSDANALIDEVRTGLAAAINALALPITVAQPAAQTYIDLTANVAGAFFWVESPNIADLEVLDTTVDPGTAAELAAIVLVDNSWYGLLLTAKSKAIILAAAAWVETAKKLLIASSQDSAIPKTAIGGGDVADTVRTTNYGRTAVVYHPNPSAFADAAWMGARLPYNPGSETWKFAQLAGVSTVGLTDNQVANIGNKRANHFQDVGGIAMTGEGVVGANEFIDVVRFIDWQQSRIAERTFAALASAVKVPFTNRGAQVVAGAVQAALGEGVRNGGLSDDPAPVVTVPKVADVSAADKSARTLSGITFSGTLAGAIHKVKIAGNLSL